MEIRVRYWGSAGNVLLCIPSERAIMAVDPMRGSHLLLILMSCWSTPQTCEITCISNRPPTCLPLLALQRVSAGTTTMHSTPIPIHLRAALKNPSTQSYQPPFVYHLPPPKRSTNPAHDPTTSSIPSGATPLPPPPWKELRSTGVVQPKLGAP